MYDFIIVLGTVFIVFAVMIWWFMCHEETKAFNYHSRRVDDLRRTLKATDDIKNSLIKANKNLSKEMDRLGDHGKKLANRITELDIAINDHLDCIAESLGKRVTLKTWQKKTVAGKMATILKKIEKK